MRDIKSRGKRIDNGKWVYGSLLIDYVTGKFFIHAIGNSVNDSDKVGEEGILNFVAFEVIPETAGQYTGLKDNNGKEIYEGDIVRTALGYTQKVIWSDMYAAFVAVYKDKDRLNRSSMPYRVDCTDEIIGNIHENPELLGVKI